MNLENAKGDGTLLGMVWFVCASESGRVVARVRGWRRRRRVFQAILSISTPPVGVPFFWLGGIPTIGGADTKTLHASYLVNYKGLLVLALDIHHLINSHRRCGPSKIKYPRLALFF